MLTAAAVTAADLRAERARAQRSIYELAPIVRIHPSRLGMLFNGRLPLSPDVAARILAALQGERESA
jgi:hypothetical protein